MRAARLRRSSDIALVRAEGRSVRRHAFSARVRRTDVRATRIAVTASRHVGTAVVRNRARRRVRDAIRRVLVSAKPVGFDVVVSVSPAALRAPFASLLTDAVALFREEDWQ